MSGEVTESMKTGLVTQVFKKKRNNTDSKNYRGITVIPIITKILELIIRARIKSLILEKQTTLQRGFTDKSSPMNTALTLEKYIRDRKYYNLCWHTSHSWMQSQRLMWYLIRA